jgi:putative ubiquitin-RnfH superfamily antitoxin RatB of RatAB toxin-antitoxin module
MAITIRIGHVPGTIKEVALEDGATVAQALVAADLDSTGYEIKAGGRTLISGDVLTNGALVLLTKQIKGNMPDAISVRAGMVPGTIKEVAVECGATVAAALRAAELDSTGYEIKAGGRTLSLTDVVTAGMLILLTKQIKGNMPAPELVEVRAGMVPGTIKTLRVGACSTIAEVLAEADLDSTGYEIKAGGRTLALGDTVTSGMLILLTKQIKGNESK